MRVRPPRSLLLAALAFACAAPPAAADKPGAADGAAGTATAHISWDGADVGVANVHLTIARNGATTFDGDPFAGGDCEDGGCSLAPLGGSPLTVRDLDGDGTPEVLVDSYTGGAHCCQLTQIFRAGAAGDVRQERNWGNPGYRLADLDKNGRAEFITADDRFSYRYTSYAFSVAPVRVLTWRAGSFRVATKRFPALVRREIARLRKGLRDPVDPRGLVAAIAADLYTLGRGRDARAFLARAPGSRAFHARVLRDLRKLGYR